MTEENENSPREKIVMRRPQRKPARPEHKEEKVAAESHDSDNQENNNDDGTRRTINLQELKTKKPADLFIMAEEYGAESGGSMLKQDLIFSILKTMAGTNCDITTVGVLEVNQDGGFGYLRSPQSNFLASADDVYVSPSQIRRYGLYTGDTIEGFIRAPKEGEKYFSLIDVQKINYEPPEMSRHKANFDTLTAIHPTEKFNLDFTSGTKKDLSTRVIDLFAPLGKGQRALIVAPPRAGKTILMKNIAHAITTHHPEVTLMVLLIDERPEEVTDMQRSVKGEVVSSTFDEPAHRHVALAEMVIAKAKRLVEHKKDVVILLDSITRLGRAYNTVSPSSGKVLSGGVDANALQRPKKFFGAARNIEEGGSITIIATALIDTGSRMDELIFEEFKGTGNSEIILDRKMSDKRIYPAIDIVKSGTRMKELLIDKNTLSKINLLFRILDPMGAMDGMEFLIKKMKDTKDNIDFFEQMNTTGSN